MLKIDWGTKIIIIICVFVLMMGTMVYMSLQQNIELVVDDYYEQELQYQDRINEKNNANALPEKVMHEIDPTGIHLHFPSYFKNKNITGSILFFRPSDQSKDFKTPIVLNSDGQQFISKEHLRKGKYDLKISWTAEGKSYLTEEVIVIQ